MYGVYDTVCICPDQPKSSKYTGSIGGDLQLVRCFAVSLHNAIPMIRGLLQTTRETPPPFACLAPVFYTRRYGNQRLWGAVGFGVASLIGGILCDAAGGSYETDMLFFVVVMVVALVASTGVLVGQIDELPDGKEETSR